MDLEQAITTALRYENQLRDIYLQGAREANDPKGKKIYQDLADDEQSHVEYLEHKLRQWQETGQITVEKLESNIPSLKSIRKEVAKASYYMSKKDSDLQEQQLSKALEVEKETSRFYQQLVSELSEEGRDMFSRFLEIENAHLEAVQFELDYVSHSGTWFGFEEFNLEVE
jgi:rubrerythrin